MLSKAAPEGKATVGRPWSKRYECDACLDCGRSDRRHWSRGLCAACWQRRYQAGMSLPEPPRRERWSPWGDACLVCGESSRPHRAHGRCRRCYGTEYSPSPEVKAKALKTARRLARVSRDRAYGLTAELPADYEDLVFGVFGRRCVRCGAEAKLVLDHHRPLQQGHALLHNAVPLCLGCNRRKKTKAPENFYDGWKLVEVLIGLHEVRARFDARLNPQTGAEAA